jgi:hypothetical protein
MRYNHLNNLKMTYSVITNRTLFQSNSKKEAKNYAYLSSRDLAPTTGHSPSIQDIESPILVSDENGNEIAVYKFTKNAVKSITKNGY